MSSCTIPTCGRPLHHDQAHRTACHHCEHRIRAWLREIPLQQPLLEASLQRDRQAPGPARPGGRAHPPLPVRADVLSLTGPAPPDDTLNDPYGDASADQNGPPALTDTLTSWTRLITEERHLIGPAGRPTNQQLTAWLATHLDWATHQPWIADFHQELGDLIRRIRAITRTEPRRHPLKAPCPRCGDFALVEEDWQPYIDCEVCGRLLTRAEYIDHANAVLPPLYRTALRLITTQPPDAEQH